MQAYANTGLEIARGNPSVVSQTHKYDRRCSYCNYCHPFTICLANCLRIESYLMIKKEFCYWSVILNVVLFPKFTKLYNCYSEPPCSQYTFDKK